jgi:hypothetical protein
MGHEPFLGVHDVETAMGCLEKFQSLVHNLYIYAKTKTGYRLFSEQLTILQQKTHCTHCPDRFVSDRLLSGART